MWKEEDASDFEEEGLSGVCPQKQRPRKPAVLPTVKEGSNGSCPKNAVNELIHEHLGEDGDPVQFVTKENALQAVESIDFRPAGRPVENEKGSIGGNHSHGNFPTPQR